MPNLEQSFKFQFHVDNCAFMILLPSSFPQIRNPSTNLCIDSMGRKAGGELALMSCHGMMGNQVHNELHNDLHNDTKVVCFLGPNEKIKSILLV